MLECKIRQAIKAPSISTSQPPHFSIILGALNMGFGHGRHDLDIHTQHTIY